MPLPIAYAIAYLVGNLALTIWIERERERGREPVTGLAATSRVLRYGPPLAGVVYLEVIAEDWLFFTFIVAFFALSFWLLGGLLNFPSRPRKDEPRR